VQEFECQQESKKKPADYYAPLRVELILQKKASNDNENVLNMALYWKTRKLSVGEIDV
jgi:hypothetical protein